MQYLILLGLLLIAIVSSAIIGACTLYVVAQNHVYE